MNTAEDKSLVFNILESIKILYIWQKLLKSVKETARLSLL